MFTLRHVRISTDTQGYTVDQDKVPASAAQASQGTTTATRGPAAAPNPDTTTATPTPVTNGTSVAAPPAGEKTTTTQNKEAKKASIWARCCGSSKDYAQ